MDTFINEPEYARSLIEASLDPLVTINTDGKIMDVNEAMAKITGKEREKLIGTDFKDYFTDPEKAREVYQQVFAKGFVANYPLTIIDGVLTDVLFNGSVFKNNQGKVIGAVVVARDVTERNRLQKAFDIERQQFYDLFSEAPFSLGVLSGSDHRFEMANPMYLQLIGISDIIGKTVKEVLPEIESQGFFEILDTVYKTGNTFTANEMLVQFDLHGTGKLVDTYLNFIYQAHRDDQNEIDGILFFAIDVTEQVVSRKKIEESENRFRTLIENSTDIKTLTSKEGRIIYSSPSLTTALGFSLEEYSDKYPSEIIHPDDLQNYLENKNEILKNPGKSFHFEQRRLHKNGNWIWVEGIVTNMLHETAIIALVSNFTDISEKKKAEEIQEFDKNNLNALINNTNDLMWSVDTNFNLITSNKPFDEMTNRVFARTIEKGENVLSVTSSVEMKNDFRKLYERAFSGESFTENERFDFPVRSWAEISYYPIINNGVIVGTACQSRNITERKKTEHRLKKSEAFNRGVLNSLNSHIAVLDFHGYILAVNDSWSQFGLENSSDLSATGVGSNYYDVCEKAIASNSEWAMKAYEGMKDVMDEKIKDFYLEYPCHSPTEQRWFGMTVIKFESKEPMIVVAHYNISERKKAEEEILDKNIQLKSLLHIAQTIREEERTNLAREIHDELGQQLTALKMDIDWILHKQSNPETKVISKLNEMLKMNDGIINTVRRISSDLRPAIIDDIGLVATIEWKCADFENKSGIQCRFLSNVTERKYSKDFSIHLYRILQETLTNINRHANASYVNISLIENDSNEMILEIQDNGKGISKENLSNKKRLGILGMKERAGLLKGELTITGDENKGTLVKLILSLENERTDS